MKRPSPRTTIDGRLERITYHNGDNHYTIAKFRTAEHGNLVSIIGYMPSPKIGDALKVTGHWENHPKWGAQLRFESFQVLLPADVDGMKAYLSSGFIKGLGPKMAGRLIRRFKEQTLAVIEDHPERLMEVEGIGPAMAARISESWKTHHQVRSLMQFLQENGVKAAYCARIFKTYGADAEQILRTEPYRVADDIPGIGFRIADALVQHAGIPVDSSQRARACILHLLEQAAEEGHMFHWDHHLTAKCENIFGIDSQSAADALKALVQMDDVVMEAMDPFTDENAVYLKVLHRAETDVARRLLTMHALASSAIGMDTEKITAEVVRRLAIQPSEEQLRVIEGVLSNRVAVITGGPGTGKTTLIRSVTVLLETLGKRVLLAAPTGRAARRISEVSGKKAATLHRLLGFNLSTGLFDKDPDNPLDADAVIVDEASMVDALLMYHLMRAVPVTSMLILVGDVFQLPSVGPGNVLADLIRSGIVRTFELTEIFRQDRQSPIVLNAHRVRRGEELQLPDLDTGDGLSEFYFIQQHRPEAVADTIIDLCIRHIPERFGYHGIRDIQVLTPIHNGVAGTLNLNQRLQAELNIGGSGIQAPGGTFRAGDKVMHLRNNYHKEVFNGDIGIISAVDAASESITVDFEGRCVDYDTAELDELALAYAISIHKSQGSEYPAVVIPMITQHYTMLQRNLLYTALTRGKHLVVLVGSHKAVSIALANDQPGKRLSALSKRLSGRNFSELFSAG